MTGQAAKTGQPTESPAGRRTRRQLLAGGTGALAAVLAAETLARPAPAYADNGNPVILGSSNTATSETIISNSTAGDIAQPWPGSWSTEAYAKPRLRTLRHQAGMNQARLVQGPQPAGVSQPTYTYGRLPWWAPGG